MPNDGGTMALSEEEQRTLEQLEAILAQDDPQLAHTLRGTQARRFDPRRTVLVVLGVIAGLALLVAGMQWHWSIAVVGFLAMFGATAWFITTTPAPDSTDLDDDDLLPDEDQPQRRHRGARPRSQGAFMDRLEERWRRRQDEGR